MRYQRVHNCCSKRPVKRGLWSPDEDLRLITYIHSHGAGCWPSLPDRAGLQRCGKSCRLRWMNYLRPGIKRGKFSEEEENTIIGLHTIMENRWSQIAKHLPGRTDSEIKNYWHSRLKKKKASACSTSHASAIASDTLHVDVQNHSPNVANNNDNDRCMQASLQLQHSTVAEEEVDSTVMADSIVIEQDSCIDSFMENIELTQEHKEPCVPQDSYALYNDALFSNIFSEDIIYLRCTDDLAYIPIRS